MKIALLQLAVLEKNKEGNVAHGLQLAAAAAKEHDLVVLPEVWTTGYSLGHLEQDAEGENSPVIAELQRIAQAEGCAILAGSVPMRHDGKIYNTSVAIDKDGTIVNMYDKVHLFGLFNEEKFFAPGNNFNAFTLDGVCCGSTICYDLRFPELYRHLALQGAQVIFCPAEWPEARGDIWRLLAQARAAENHIFLVAVNCAGTFKGAPFYGHSMVVAPSGKILAEAGMAEEVISCDINLADIAKVRSRINALADVRKELIQ
ncbi:carbon-nitrogen family hydrolase [Phascolarctobacterium sp.]|uniref:carbon-nitrogen family hydrolase n=1 Tax=Phascolarctobacterium sp. TaxID=2049039 RepID=UPI00386FBD28